MVEAEELANRLQQELLDSQKASTETALNTDEQTAQQQTEQKGLTQEPQATSNDSMPPVGQQDEQLEHRYKVLQGKYNSEVPRLSAENKELKSRLAEIEQKLLDLQNATPPQPLVSPQEIEEYGEGLIDVARRIAREELAGKALPMQMPTHAWEANYPTRTEAQIVPCATQPSLQPEF